MEYIIVLTDTSSAISAEKNLLTASGQRNRLFATEQVDVSGLPFWQQELLFDPQTSGGLLIAANAGQADKLLGEIRRSDPRATIIGCIAEKKCHLVSFI